MVKIKLFEAFKEIKHEKILFNLPHHHRQQLLTYLPLNFLQLLGVLGFWGFGVLVF